MNLDADIIHQQQVAKSTIASYLAALYRSN